MKNLMILAGLALVAGCTSPAPESKSASPDPKTADKPFKVALLTPGPISDAGWSAMAYEGLKGIEAELGAEVSNEENVGGAKIKDSMRSYAQDGYTLVFGHGFEYNEPATEVAKDFPNTVFISSSGGKTAANVGAFRFYLEQGFYLAGATAAQMSKSGIIATVAIQGIPSIDSTLEAYRAGARSIKPDIKIIDIKLANDKDLPQAFQATKEALNQGADFVIHQANAAAQKVFDACKEKPGTYAFGANLDQNANPSGVVLASAVIVAKPAFVDLAKRVKEGTYKGEIAVYGMDKGAIDFVWNPTLANRVPAAVQEKVSGLKEQVMDSELVVPKAEF